MAHSTNPAYVKALNEYRQAREIMNVRRRAWDEDRGSYEAFDAARKVRDAAAKRLDLIAETLIDEGSFFTKKEA